TFYTRVGKHIGSTSLLATAADSRNDTIITISVLIGAIVNKFTNVVLDGYLGVLIALFIIYSGIKLVLETADPILGVPPSRETIREIGEKILSYDGIIGIHDLIVHNYGEGRCFASVHCEVPANEDVLKSHDIIDNIEFDFLREKGISLVIHMDPVVTDDENANKLREQVSEIIFDLARKLDEEISMHDFRVVVGQTHTNLIFDVVLNYSCKTDEKDVVAFIEHEIKKLSLNYNAVINVDRSFISSKE
ncbi:MAG: cation diffusion facilitator family transporter, partial [Clostridia bacterium]|nr:cation diffusion facilitator family transporter [Clostridia bacterium]